MEVLSLEDDSMGFKDISNDEIIKIVNIVNALTSGSGVTVNCGCCDGGIYDPEEDAHYAEDDDDHSHGCDPVYIPTPGGGVTVNCCCSGDGGGIIDPENLASG